MIIIYRDRVGPSQSRTWDGTRAVTEPGNGTATWNMGSGPNIWWDMMAIIIKEWKRICCNTFGTIPKWSQGGPKMTCKLFSNSPEQLPHAESKKQKLCTTISVNLEKPWPRWNRDHGDSAQECAEPWDSNKNSANCNNLHLTSAHYTCASATFTLKMLRVPHWGTPQHGCLPFVRVYGVVCVFLKQN